MPNKGIRFGAAAAAVLLVLSGIAAAGVASADPGDDASLEGHGASDAWVKKQLRTMSLEEKVGQLFTTFAYGETADTDKPDDVKRNQDLHGVDNAAELIETYNIGGIIYFGWSDNLNDPQQIAELSNGMQDVAVDRRGDVPLLVSTDQEHGTVVRLGPPATQFPGNMALGATGSSDDAYNAGLIAGRELRAVGINEDFAPVADVNVNPANPVIGVRSFSSDPQLAAELTGAAVQGYQAPSNAWMPCWVGNCQSVSSTAKHFPGHGNTDTDSHTDLPTIPHTYEE
ncbi:MAG: glycoside hydrolase family 3 N-terminal domain-containing protein, partial [Stackebrandtia sp.]